MVTAQVKVNRRETERQAEARVNSYAYISAQEAEEPWIGLAPIAAVSETAHKSGFVEFALLLYTLCVLLLTSQHICVPASPALASTPLPPTLSLPTPQTSY